MMSRKRNMGLVERLAIARASGITTKAWAAANGIPISTAMHWAGTPAFREKVERHREELARCTIARVAEHVARGMLAGPVCA
jgi:hypothetical protein